MSASTEELEVVLAASGDVFHQEGEKFEETKVEERPEDAIPDLPENQAAREFLRTAPKVGLHMPFAKEVKVMQCFRCKSYGHRAGDRECPMSVSGNILLDSQRRVMEDPMSAFVQKKQMLREEKYERVQQLMLLMDEIRTEEAARKARKKEKKKKKHSKRNRSGKDHDRKDKKSHKKNKI